METSTPTPLACIVLGDAHMVRISVLWIACLACTEHGSGGTLVNPTCDTVTCDSDELCRFQAQGIDSGVSNPPTCVVVPRLCPTDNCSGDCPECIRELCAAPELPVSLSNRVLSCSAQ